MTQWKVLKHDEEADEEFAHGEQAWNLIGTHESESTYSLHYERDLAQSLGESFGAGEFLLLDDEGQRYEKITIGERQDFYEVEDETPDHFEGSIGANIAALTDENVEEMAREGLSEGDLETAAGVMERDG